MSQPIGPDLGKTMYDGQTPDASNLAYISSEGITRWFENSEVRTAAGVATIRNQKRRRAILVRNTNATAIVAGSCYKWTADFHGRRVDGVSGAAEELAGVADENLPSTGCVQNDLFWLFVEGEHLVNKVTTDVIADGDFLATGALGNVVAAATIDVDGSHIGRAVAAAGNPSAQVLVEIKASHS
jgi:hypothetical protein